MSSQRVRVAHLTSLGAILVAAACSSGGSGGSGGYDNGVRDRFVAACTQTSSGQTEACQAAYECVSHRLAFADFKAADEAIRAGRPVDPATSRVLVECANASAPPG
jgi:hypothetical protein